MDKNIKISKLDTSKIEKKHAFISRSMTGGPMEHTSGLELFHYPHSPLPKNNEWQNGFEAGHAQATGDIATKIKERIEKILVDYPANPSIQNAFKKLLSELGKEKYGR